MRKHRAFTLVELLVVIGIIAVLIAILLPVLNGARERAYRIKCAANLRSIGQALQLYYGNHKQYPRGYYEPGANVNAWIGSFSAGRDRDGKPVPGIPNSVTMPLFLLFREKYVPLDVFLCPSYPVDKTWVTQDHPTDSETLRRHCFDFDWAMPGGSILSYSYASPYPPTYRSEESEEGGGMPGGGGGSFQVPFVPPGDRYKGPPHVASDFAVAADANNTLTRPPLPGGARYRSSDPPARIRYLNSLNHNRAGQNVLYFDGHVSWCETSFCGHAGDNIYLRKETLWAAGLQGISNWETRGEWPLTRNDSVLLPSSAYFWR